MTKYSLLILIFFAFWRNFAPKTTLLHLPNKIEKKKKPLVPTTRGKSLSKPGPPPTTRQSTLELQSAALVCVHRRFAPTCVAAFLFSGELPAQML
jgi:hypothetical protein